jgi:hypothetical protein
LTNTLRTVTVDGRPWRVKIGQDWMEPGTADGKLV